MDLHGKRALVTGGAKRVGAAIVRRLAAAGCRVVVHYNHSDSEARRLRDEIKKRNGGIVDLEKADLLKPRDIEALARRVARGGLDILVNNASLYYPRPLERTAERDWDAMMGIHARAPFLLSRALVPFLKKSEGRIINIADTAAWRPYPKYLAYCVSKAALMGLTRALAVELAPRIHVSSVCPGPIEPPPWESASVIRGVARRNLLKKWGGVDEVARAVIFLCESDYATGSHLVIDGGYQLV